MPDSPAHEVLVCNGPECGGRRFSADLLAQLRKLIRARGLEATIRVDSFRCFGKCQSGPNVLTRTIGPGPAPPVVATDSGARLHLGVGPADAARILDGLVADPAGGATDAPAEPGPACAVAPFAR